MKKSCRRVHVGQTKIDGEWNCWIKIKEMYQVKLVCLQHKEK